MVTAFDFDRGRVTKPDQSAVYRNSLFDSLLYATAGTTQMTFFAQPVGQGITSALGGVVGAPKSYADTNMNVANMLPSGLEFSVETIEVDFRPGSVATANTYTPANISVFNAASSATLQGFCNDVNTFYQSGWLELNILQQNYVREAPLNVFPPSHFIDGFGALATTSATAGQTAVANVHAAGHTYIVEPEITLQPAMNFEVVLKWPGAVPTPSGFNGRVMVRMGGLFMRAVQG